MSCVQMAAEQAPQDPQAGAPGDDSDEEMQDVEDEAGATGDQEMAAVPMTEDGGPVPVDPQLAAVAVVCSSDHHSCYDGHWFPIMQHSPVSIS